MTTVFLPVSRVSVSYTVKRGRRWTLLEHLLLLELCAGHAKASELSYASGMPTRLVVESLISLLRAGWIEVRATDDATLFAATPAGHNATKSEELEAARTVHPRRTSICFDRIVGGFMKSDELDLLHENKLPADALRLEPRTFTVPQQDGELIERLYYDADETFDDWRGFLGVSNRFYARLDVTPQEITGLPGYASLGLRQEIFEQAAPHISSRLRAAQTARAWSANAGGSAFVGTLDDGDIVAGGQDHLELLKDVLRRAASFVAIHSCFIRHDAIERLMPELQGAADRGVRVDLIWGVARAEDGSSLHPIEKVRGVLARLSASAKRRVTLGDSPTGSHAKLLIHDAGSEFEAVIGSCNWLSANYGQVEISVRSRHPLLVARIAQILAGLQMPSSGPWPASTRRLLDIWQGLRSRPPTADGVCELSLVLDDEHYAVVRRARDVARVGIVVGCDLYGIAAETSVLAPTATSAAEGVRVTIVYSKLTDRLRDEGRGPDERVLKEQGIECLASPGLHGKFMGWDARDVTITSFNWLSTVVDPSKPRFAEIGLSISGDGVGAALMRKVNSTGLIVPDWTGTQGCPEAGFRKAPVGSTAEAGRLTGDS